jgi:hypothetical protein
MTTQTKPKSTSNSWMARFLYLPVPGTTSDAPAKAEPKGPEPRRRSWRTALRRLFRKTAIEQDLTAGANLSSRECRRRRASELTGPRTREALAASYENLLAGLTHTLPFGLAHPNWRAVRVAAPLLERIASRLREDPGVRAKGVARAKRLLSERGSALYARDSARLVDEATSTLAALCAPSPRRPE